MRSLMSIQRPVWRTSGAFFVGLSCWFLAPSAWAATYEVGPGKAFENISDAPLETLEAGDEVLIYYRAEPYRESFGIDRAGTAENPIVIRGVPGPGGERPIIDGEGSSEGPGAHNRGLVHVSSGAEYVVIEGLEIRNANSDAGFPDNAASVFAPGGNYITFRNLDIHHSGNGFFSWVDASNILVEGCFIHDNGNVGSNYEHNIYTESNGIVFQYNRIMPLRSGAPGNNLKDRSQGTVVRFNWIEGGNRVLDLVEAEDGAWDHTDDPSHVYGNVLIKHEDTGQSQVVHFGQDNGMPPRRLLLFYHNTVVTQRSDRTTVFFINSDTRVEARNNVFVSNGGVFEVLDPDDSSGANLVLGPNWIPAGYVMGSNSASYEGTENLLEGNEPGLTSDYRPGDGSPQVDAGSPLPQGYHEVAFEYAGQGAARARMDSRAPDLGAFALESTGEPIPGQGGSGGFAGTAQGGSAQGGSAQGGSAQGGSAQGGSGGSAGNTATGGGNGDSGCGCRVTPGTRSVPLGVSAAVGLLLLGRVSRRKRKLQRQ